MAQHKTFRFLDLPGELRNIIYDMAIAQSDARMLELSHARPRPRRTKLFRNKKPKLPSVLKVNKQLFNEGVNIYYSKLTFSFAPCYFDDATQWYARLSLRSRQAMKHFRYGPSSETASCEIKKIRDRMEDLGVKELPKNVEVSATDELGWPIEDWTNDPDATLQEWLRSV